MSTVLGIDPGPEESAWVLWDGERILQQGDTPNEDLLWALSHTSSEEGKFFKHPFGDCAIEQIRGFGVMASDKLFDTCWWSGRFVQAYGAHRTAMVPRKVAAAHVCGVGGISKDQFVREAIISRFGGKEAAIGSKRQPGPLYGVSGHRWAALAIALTWVERYGAGVCERVG